MKHIFLATVASSSLLFTSCGDKDKDSQDNNDSSGNNAPAAVKELTATEAAEGWKNDLTSGKVANLWNSLPKSYQSDITNLAHSFGNKVDAEVYNEAMSTLGSVASLLKNKKEIILEIIKEQAPAGKADDVAKITEHYDSIVGILSTITSSSVKDAESVKNLDVAKLLGDLQTHTEKLSALASLSGKDFEKVKNVKFSLVSESGDTAEVKATIGDDEKTKTLVKKDGRWVPADMAKEWAKKIEEANKGLNKLGDMKPEEKQKALMGIGMVKMTVQGLEKAKTKEELMQQVQGLMGMFMGGR